MGPLRIPSIPRSARKISILEESNDATRSRKDPGLEIDESLGDERAAALQICLPGYAIYRRRSSRVRVHGNFGQRENYQTREYCESPRKDDI